MIIPGNALLALLSPPQEFQGTREEEGSFGELLTEIEQHTASLPDQEGPEDGSLACVLQVLMNILQSCTPANPSPMVSTPETGESSLGSIRPAGGLPLRLLPDGGTAPALWDTEEVKLLSSMGPDGAQGIAQLVFSALDGQSTGSAPVTAGAPENFSWLFHPQENTQDLREFFKAQPTVVSSGFLPASELDTPSGALLPATTPSFSRDSVLATAEAQFVSPGFQLVTPSVAQEPMPLLSSPQAAAATTSEARGTMALVQEGTALPEYDASAASRQRSESREWVAETLLSVAPLTLDSVLPSSSARATSHIPSVAPTVVVPTNHSLEDLGRPWPLPLSPNTVVLHLEPRELGALLLRVRVNDKRLIASFQTQSPEAETLLRSHLPSLHESLSQRGFEVQPIAITRVAEGFSAHMGAGTGAFAHQHSAFQGFAEDWQAANASETQDEVDLQRAPRWSVEQRPRLLDVVI